jgi:hypothetical protein
MAKKVSNPFTDLNGSSVSDVKNWLYASSIGKIFILQPGEDNKTPVLQIGGPENEQISTADKVTDGTIEKTYFKEGMQTNPLSIYPSSYFMPVPPQINSTLPGPLSVISNPELLITIIAVTAAATKKEEDTYSYHKKTLPTKVIDNQEMEDMLFE